MNGDYQGTATGRNGTLTDTNGNVLLDQAPLRGTVRESDTLDGTTILAHH